MLFGFKKFKKRKSAGVGKSWNSEQREDRKINEKLKETQRNTKIL